MAFITQLEPRFGEFDLGGVLYHTNYWHLFETMREAFLRQGPISYPMLVSDHCHLAVMETKQKFLKPISYGEKIRGELTVSEINKASVVFEYKLFTKIFVHQACSKMVFVRTGADKYKITPLPEELIEYFKGYVVASKFND